MSWTSSVIRIWWPSSAPCPMIPEGHYEHSQSRTLAFSQQQLSANVGGPIIKDKLFYFVGAERFIIPRT